MFRVGVLLLLGMLALAPGGAPGQPAEEFDRFGGWTTTSTVGTGWFRVEEVGGRWWMIDPEGHPFLSIGVNAVSYRPDTPGTAKRSPYGEVVAQKYGHPREWAAAATARLRDWGFNTLGAWSDPVTWRQDFAYTVLLDLSRAGKRGERPTFPDVFDPAYRKTVMQAARRVCRPLADDPWLVGYFVDDEVRSGATWQDADTLFASFLGLGDRTPGRRGLVAFLEQRYQEVTALNEAWHTQYQSFEEVGRVPQSGSRIPEDDQAEFMRVVAERYFSTAFDAIRAADEHHLVLGCRFAESAPNQVLEAMRGYVDVVSVNAYGPRVPAKTLQRMHELTGRPVMVTEFSFGARDSGLPNSGEAGPLADTQVERAKHYETFVRELVALPMVVGYHWFQHADQTAGGGAEGGDGNCGLVNTQDEPYEELVETASRVNRAAWPLAARRPAHRAQR